MPSIDFPLRWESTGDHWWFASPIDWAAANGHYELVRELLHLDGNHLIKLTSLRRIHRLETVWDDEEQFHDVAKCRARIARKLLKECESKKGQNSLLRGGYGGWLLYTAASAGDLEFVRELLQKDPLVVFGEGEYGITDMFYAAARSKNCDVFRMVFDFAISPRFLVGSNGTELEEHLEQIPPAYKWDMTNRALHAAARGGNLKILKDLVADSSDVLAYRDIQGATILHAAAGRGQTNVVKDILASFDMISSKDKYGNTALHVAAYRGQLSAVEALVLASPSLIHFKNNAGDTFLHMAVTGFQTPSFRRLDRQIELMEQLVNREIFQIEKIVNVGNNEGRTALHLAIIGNIHSDLVELLMTATCIDVNVRDLGGMTPLDILKRRPHSESAEILTRQLISAGGFFSYQDYSARRLIASQIKMQTLGGSPGTSFRVSDAEIFVNTGIEKNVPDLKGSLALSASSSDVSLHDQDIDEHNPRKSKSRVSLDYAVYRLKSILHWPKKKRGSTEMLKKLIEESSSKTREDTPITLRERYSQYSSLPNNKRTIAERRCLPSPNAKEKLAFSGLLHGFMQSMSHMKMSRSRSYSNSSVSKISLSSHGSLDKQKGIQTENNIATPSCSNQITAERPINSIKKQDYASDPLANQPPPRAVLSEPMFFLYR
ncbi:hypothetical protein LIER_28785 [Lithospermum erythrorhizon]|uniref:Uncharacterized protein n=1 Tax=Lithospermum erythrorhizon TaxID=34254 RepID=A0AAV3RKJ0_LITER